jgi:hypothetical protein
VLHDRLSVSWGTPATLRGNTTAATSELLRMEMLPLYLYYIEDHIERPGSIGKTELASAFHEWRERLVR